MRHLMAIINKDGELISGSLNDLKTMDYPHVLQLIDEFCQALIDDAEGGQSITIKDVLWERDIQYHNLGYLEVPPLKKEED